MTKHIEPLCKELSKLAFLDRLYVVEKVICSQHCDLNDVLDSAIFEIKNKNESTYNLSAFQS